MNLKSFLNLWGFFLILAAFQSGCAHVSATSEDDYYRMVETRVGTHSGGEAEKETRETFCPSGALDGQDPQYWSLDEWATKFKQKQCLQVVCRFRGGLRSHCGARGNEAFMPKIQKERDKLTHSS